MSSSKVESIQTRLSKVGDKIDLFNQSNNIEEIKKKKVSLVIIINIKKG